jgi:hypothetical protein
MPKMEDLELIGASKNSYTFEVYPLDTTLAKHGAVYAITKRTKIPTGVIHERIFIGETDRLRDLVKNHSSKPCFAAMEANCICVYAEDDRDDRIKIVDDLLAGDVWGCNPRPR